MTGLGMGESIQEKVLKELSTNLASLMVVENWSINDSDGNSPKFSSQSDTLQVKSHILVKHPPNNKIIDLIDGRQRSIVHNYKGLNCQSIVQIQ